MPKASVHKNGRPVAAQQQVGLAGEMLGVEAVAHAVAVQEAAHQHLGARVLAPYVRHHDVPLFRRERVGHG